MGTPGMPVPSTPVGAGVMDRIPTTPATAHMALASPGGFIPRTPVGNTAYRPRGAPAAMTPATQPFTPRPGGFVPRTPAGLNPFTPPLTPRGPASTPPGVVIPMTPTTVGRPPPRRV